MTEKTKQKAVIYLRIASVPANVSDAFSEIQESTCHRCAEQNDLEVIKIFHDHGSSGNDPERPALQAVVEFMKKNPDHTLIVADPSRLARNAQHMLHLMMDLCVTNRITILSADTSRQISPHIAA